ncbi:hypothetical protein A2164_01310 [Candidatus Curtissbacteria bacterium RBG_13_35_7]|uniref:DUF2079 domain-containing protein n=1 Tax=Candidatus Curtissbacteria bacterium RBG_13_35_7 TaxID=1797705 RepID=A0A1F5G0D6_9BACT|nr:MAG: hypothetical protein A2164_01310 [Candidatus Curtissbacteria bacterium RBG_13_35_7]
MTKNSIDHNNLIIKADFWIIVFLFLFFTFLYNLLAITRHNHFQSYGIDFSTYDQPLWLLSKFQEPISTIYNLNTLADRFRPIIFPLSLLYWFTQNERIILVFQSVILSAAIFPLWLIAKKYLPRILAIIITFLYIDFIGIQSAVVYDFHEMALLPFFLAWLFYFLINKKWNYYFIFLILCLSIREHVGLLLSTLGIYIWLVKKNAKIALATTFTSFIYSIIAIKLIMPTFGQTDYSSFTYQGDSLENALLAYISHPSTIISNFFFPIQKSQTLLLSFLSFGLIPILYLALIPTIIFQFLSRFLDQLHPIRWTLYYHYSVELAVLLTISTIFGSKMILKHFEKYKYILLIIIFLLLSIHLSTNIILNAPLKNLLNPQFYKNETWMDNTRKILSIVPDNASVAAQNNLLPHLSHRKEIYLLPKINNADYIVVDLHPGQNNWNFYTEDLEKTRSLFNQLIINRLYEPIASAGNAYLLRKTNFDK